MATIVHRRPMRPATPVARGPGASLAALTPVGWASVVLAIGWIVVAVLPGLTITDARQVSWGPALQAAWAALPYAAVVGLPAALEWGVPGARRRAPWLMRGAVLLALATLADEAISQIRGLLWDTTLDLPLFGEVGEGLFDGGVVWAVPTLLGLGVAVVELAGIWALSDGLADAGGRLGRRALAAAVVVGIVPALLWVPTFATYGGMDLAIGDLASIAASSLLGLVAAVLWLMVAGRLLAGWRAGVPPRRAWRLGAVAGLVVVAGQLSAFAGLLGPLDERAWYLVSLVWVLPRVLLVAAFLAGLGRGRERRSEVPRRRRLAVVWGGAAR